MALVLVPQMVRVLAPVRMVQALGLVQRMVVQALRQKSLAEMRS
jgi:hypothetical protein